MLRGTLSTLDPDAASALNSVDADPETSAGTSGVSGLVLGEAAAAATGAPVTITGTGFGATRSGGNVLLGSINGIIISWSDTQIVAVVAPNST